MKNNLQFFPLFRLVVILFLLFTYPNISLAEIRYVSKTGTSIPPYTSWETASDSIQKCINTSSFGDTIYVANGTYIEKIIMIHGLALIGAGMDSCIIDTRTIATPPGYYALTMKDECSIEGFHIIVRTHQGGTTAIRSGPSSGDSIYYNGGKIINNKMSKVGTGITTSNSFLTIANNILEDIEMGMHFGALDTTVIDSVYNNYFFGIISRAVTTILVGRAIIYNNYINTVSDYCYGVAIGGRGGSKIFNNVIYDSYSSNSSRYQKGIDLTFGSFAPVADEAYNNVIIMKSQQQPSNSYDEGIRFGYPNIVRNNLVIGADRGYTKVSGNQNIYYNNAWKCRTAYYGFAPDSSNLNTDPMVVNDDITLGEFDFHLQMFSPLIDAGDPSILDKDSTRSDIGLYGGPYGESYTYQDLAPRAPVNFTALVDTTNILLSWNQNTETDFSIYRLYRDTTANFPIGPDKLISEQKDTFFIEIPHIGSRIYYKVTAIDKQGNESLPSEELFINLTTVENEPVIVSNYILYQNYPNPFNPSTKIAYQLRERGYVKLYVYDMTGELVQTLVNQHEEGGYYEVEFSPKNISSDDLASGIYIYQIMIKNDKYIPVFTEIKKMIYLK